MRVVVFFSLLLTLSTATADESLSIIKTVDVDNSRFGLDENGNFLKIVCGRNILFKQTAEIFLENDEHQINVQTGQSRNMDAPSPSVKLLATDGVAKLICKPTPPEGVITLHIENNSIK